MHDPLHWLIKVNKNGKEISDNNFGDSTQPAGTE